MSNFDGWDALHLRTPKRVPRTEYSASEHWELLSVVTGIPVTTESDATTKTRAQQAFHQAWHFDFFWSIMVDAKEFGTLRTNMGHAVYAAGGTDWNANVSALFTEPEQVLGACCPNRCFSEDFSSGHAGVCVEARAL